MARKVHSFVQVSILPGDTMTIVLLSGAESENKLVKYVRLVAELPLSQLY